MTDLALTLLAGAAVLVGAMSLGLWQVLSAPDRPNYPTSGPVKRAVMFWLMVMLSGRGVEIVTGAFDPEAPVRLSAWAVGGSVFLGAFFVVMLVDHLRHWLPAKTHRRIRQLLAVANCRPSPGLIAARTRAMQASTGAPCLPADVVGPALVELRLEGFEAAGPHGGPEVFTDH